MDPTMMDGLGDASMQGSQMPGGMPMPGQPSQGMDNQPSPLLAMLLQLLQPSLMAAAQGGSMMGIPSQDGATLGQALQPQAPMIGQPTMQ